MYLRTDYHGCNVGGLDTDSIQDLEDHVVSIAPEVFDGRGKLKSG